MNLYVSGAIRKSILYHYMHRSQGYYCYQKIMLQKWLIVPGVKMVVDARGLSTSLVLLTSFKKHPYKILKIKTIQNLIV